MIGSAARANRSTRASCARSPERLFPLLALLIAGVAVGGSAASATAPHAELVGIATLPADSFAGGPPSGQYDGDGRRLAEPRFPAQPLQGVSAIQRATRGSWWALSDNGFGTQANSRDYRLAIHRFALRPRTQARDARAVDDASRVRLLERLPLADPRRRFPHPLALGEDGDRQLSGADVDPESMVRFPDGSFWIGDEFGPWLLHFDRRGRLQAPPVELDGVRSPQHPRVRAGLAEPTLARSKGFEGLAAQRRDGRTLLYALLEGPVRGDASGDGDPPERLRLLEFDPQARSWTGRRWAYRLEDAAHAIGELAPLPGDDAAFLVIERDDLDGDAARFKRIYRVDLGRANADGTLVKTLLVDLLHLADPRGLAGTPGGFRFPHQTIESVAVVGPNRLLVVNDNNFRSAGARGPGVPNATEWIWVHVDGGFVPTRSAAAPP